MASPMWVPQVACFVSASLFGFQSVRIVSKCGASVGLSDDMLFEGHVVRTCCQDDVHQTAI